MKKYKIRLESIDIVIIIHAKNMCHAFQKMLTAYKTIISESEKITIKECKK